MPRGFGFTTILFVTVFVLLLVSLIIQAIIMYKMANSTAYVLDAAKVATTEGVDAKTFWSNHKVLIAGPTVLNLLGMTVVGVLYVMA